MSNEEVTLSSELVDSYIRKARAARPSKKEEKAVQYASGLMQQYDLRWRSKPQFPPPYPGDRDVPREMELLISFHTDLDSFRWRDLIIAEIHIALCQRKKKYQREVAALKKNIDLLIAAIAGYVAASLGMAVAVVAAVVAAILRIVLAMGTAVFCKKFASLQESEAKEE